MKTTLRSRSFETENKRCKSASQVGWKGSLLLATFVAAAFAQTSRQVGATTSALQPGSKMVQANKRGQPSVPELQTTSGNSSFNEAQGPGPGPIGPGPGCNVFPAPANIGTKVSLSYFGPPPSSDNPSLVGPEQLLKSGTVDAANGTITVPLYLGYMKGTNKRFGTS